MSARVLRDLITTAYDPDMIRMLRQNIEDTIDELVEDGVEPDEAERRGWALTGDLEQLNPGIGMVLRGFGDETEGELRSIVEAMHPHHVARAWVAVAGGVQSVTPVEGGYRVMRRDPDQVDGGAPVVVPADPRLDAASLLEIVGL